MTQVETFSWENLSGIKGSDFNLLTVTMIAFQVSSVKCIMIL